MRGWKGGKEEGRKKERSEKRIKEGKKQPFFTMSQSKGEHMTLDLPCIMR